MNINLNIYIFIYVREYYNIIPIVQINYKFLFVIEGFVAPYYILHTIAAP